jgi:hypothetical protein
MLRQHASLLGALFDDAAIFPPGNAAMDDAVHTHVEHLRSWYADCVGAFVCSADRLDEFEQVLANGVSGSLDVTLTVPGGPALLDDALAKARSCSHIHLSSVELPLGGFLPAQIVELVRDRGHWLPIYVEVAVPDLTAAVAAGLARCDLRLKLRTGGTVATAFPGERVLADALAAAVTAELVFKCTAGLHNAVRHRDTATGFEHHGFLNIALAVRELLRGARPDYVRAALAESDVDRIAAAISGLTGTETAQLRSLFRSFGTCSVDEPLSDLQAMGLVGSR